jgi:hypothetical protein
MECGLTWDQLQIEARTTAQAACALKERSNGVEVRMYAVPKDGMYQLLCKACADVYIPKRKDVYGDTEIGRRLGLK